MGKTKTSFVEGVDDSKESKPSYDKAAKEAKRKAKESGLHEEKSPIDTQPEETPKAEPETKKGKGIKVRSKKYKESYAKIDRNRVYSFNEALSLVRGTSYAGFDGTLELHTVIKKEGLSVSITLPNAFGKQKVVEVASDSTIDKLKSGKVDFDVLLATPDMMPKLVAFARILGPKGLMPNPKNGTIIKSEKDAQNFSTAQVSVKTEKKAPVIHTTFGKLSQDDDKLTENFEVLTNAIGKRQIVKAVIKSSMSPSVKVKIA